MTDGGRIPQGIFIREQFRLGLADLEVVILVHCSEGVHRALHILVRLDLHDLVDGDHTVVVLVVTGYDRRG